MARASIFQAKTKLLRYGAGRVEVSKFVAASAMCHLCAGIVVGLLAAEQRSYRDEFFLEPGEETAQVG